MTGRRSTTTTMALAAPGVSNVQEYGSISRADLAEIATQLKTSEPTGDRSRLTPAKPFARSASNPLSSAPT